MVIKYGGAAMVESPERTIRDVATLAAMGLKPVLVHGGGPEINSWLAKAVRKGARGNSDKNSYNSYRNCSNLVEDIVFFHVFSVVSHPFLLREGSSDLLRWASSRSSCGA